MWIAVKLLAHRGRIALLAASTMLALSGPSWGQAADQLRGSIEDTDALADRFDDPPRPDPDADEDGSSALVLPEDFEDAVLGGAEASRRNERVRRVRGENGRLVPSEPGQRSDGETGAGTPQRTRRAIPAPQVGLPQGDGSTVPQANVARAPVQGGARDPDEPGPFDPLGLRLGPLRVVSSVEQSLGATSNAEFTPNGEGSGYSETRIDITATSDLPVHELRGRLSGSYRKFFSDAEDVPTLDAEGAFRYDLRRDTTVTLGANWNIASESATDDALLGLAGTVVGRPIVQTGGVSLEAARTGGKLFGSLRGAIGREVYGDIEFADGSRRSQFRREATLFETALRLGYAHTPAFRPFVEGEIGYRLSDEAVDENGQNRDATRYALRVGLLVDIEDKLTGSLSAGVAHVSYASPAFASLTGPSIEAAMTWSPDPLTRIGVSAATVFDDSVTAGQSGTLDYRFGMTADRDVRENLAAFASASATFRDPGGEREETTLALEAGLAWSLSRELALTGRVGYSRVDSALANADYDVKSASIGLRWQK